MFPLGQNCQPWFLVDWQHRHRPIRSHVRKLLLTNIDLNIFKVGFCLACGAATIQSEARLENLWYITSICTSIVLNNPGPWTSITSFHYRTNLAALCLQWRRFSIGSCWSSGIGCWSLERLGLKMIIVTSPHTGVKTSQITGNSTVASGACPSWQQSKHQSSA